MGSFCSRCGIETELQPAPDGSMYCSSCIQIAVSPRCIDCVKCYQKRCGDAIYACPFCHGTPESYVGQFEERLKKPVLQALRMEEHCERCGGTLAGRAFILNGKALCRDCLIYEQDRWEIVPAKPGKFGTTVRVVFEKPKPVVSPAERALDSAAAKRLFYLIGIDPDNPPPDPFPHSTPINEGKMPDDSCVSCEPYQERKRTKSSKPKGKRK